MADKPEWDESCPKCNAKPVFVVLTTDYKNKKAYSKCDKCNYIWNERDLPNDQGTEVESGQVAP